MQLLAVLPERASFSLTYSDLRSLPVRLRDKMLGQIGEWRAQEDAAFARMKTRR